MPSISPDSRHLPIPLSAASEALITTVAEGLLAGADEMIEAMDGAVLEASPALAQDPAIAAGVRESARSNLLRWLSAIAARPSAPVSADPTPESLDLARDAVRRGIERGELLNGYRVGQNVAWERWLEAVLGTAGPAELTEVLLASSRSMHAFVDGVLANIDDAIERERELLADGGLARRAETIRLILDGAPIGAGRASTRLGYELARGHLAAVLWREGDVADEGELEHAVGELTGAAGGGPRLTLPVGTAEVWAWIGVEADPDPEALSAAIADAPDDLRAAVGRVGTGIAGFRSSHEEARAAERLLRYGSPAQRLISYPEVEVIALAAADPERARQFAAVTLGGLGNDDPASRVLRDTVRAYLDAGSSAPRAAERLFTHRNTVLQRLDRAADRLGRSVNERPLALALALEIAHWLGPPGARPE